AVAQRTSHHLQNAPDRRIDGFENSDPLDAQSKCNKEQREDAPAHAVIKIIDEACLRGGKEIAIAKRRECKDLPKIGARRWLLAAFAFQANVIACVTDEKDRKRRA